MRLTKGFILGAVTGLAAAIALFTAAASADGGQVSPTQAQQQAQYFNETDAAVRTRAGLKPLSANDYASGQAIRSPDAMTVFDFYCTTTSSSQAGALPAEDSELCEKVDKALKTLPGLSIQPSQPAANFIFDHRGGIAMFVGIAAIVAAGFGAYKLQRDPKRGLDRAYKI